MLAKFVRNIRQTVFGETCRFAKDRDGAFLPTFAIAAMAVMLSAGAAVDYSQLSRARSIMNNSLDAAVLAAGHEILEGETSQGRLRTVFEDHLRANLDNHPEISRITTIETFSVNTDSGEIDAALKAPVDMAFMGLMGRPTIEVNAATQAKFSTSPVEVSMVLDVTGSMNSNGKLASLKLAAADAVDILLPEGRSNNNIKVGLVPYSAGVRLAPALASRASGQNLRTCLTERRNNPANDVSYRNEPVGADTRASCSGSLVRPMTQNRNTLRNDIQSLTADGATAGHLGIAWSYYMLSENWKNLWPADAQPDDYGTKTQKVAILMTDGEFNTYYQGVRANPQGGQIARSEAAAKALCSDMKRSKRGGDGIIIYSIAFNAPATAKQTLQHCANPDTGSKTFFFDATSEEELRSAFRQIAQDIKTLRLTR